MSGMEDSNGKKGVTGFSSLFGPLTNRLEARPSIPSFGGGGMQGTDLLAQGLRALATPSSDLSDHLTGKE